MRRALLALILLAAVAAPRANADGDSTWLPGPDARGDSTLVGFVDAPVSGATIAVNSNIEVRGWVVDSSASSGSGIDAAQVYFGLRDQGGTLAAQGVVGIARPDVAAALGNQAWSNSGFSVRFASSGLGVGQNVLTLYVHSPDNGWWYKQVQVQVPAAPPRGFADDPLLEVRGVSPGQEVNHTTTTTMTITGYAIDRNVPIGQTVGVGGSGVSQIQVYLDGPRNGGSGAGTLLGMATLGQKNREATGFGERFLNSGFVIVVHPTDFTPDRHELFIYADSAFWPSETLVILPLIVD